MSPPPTTHAVRLLWSQRDQLNTSEALPAFTMAGRNAARLLLANVSIVRAHKRNLVILIALLYTLGVANDFTGICQPAAAVLAVGSMQLRTYTAPYYILPRSDACPTIMEHWTDRQWHTRVRMTKALFMELCHLLEPELRGRDTNFKRATPVHKKVALGLMRLATGNSYVSFENELGIAAGTACVHFHKGGGGAEEGGGGPSPGALAAASVCQM